MAKFCYIPLRSLLLIFCICHFAICTSQNSNVGFLEVFNNNGSAVVEKKLFIDSNDFLWYSTFNGIVKETGSDKFIFDYYKSEKEERITYTYDIYESSNQKIWTATNNGVFCIDLKADTTTLLNVDIPNYAQFIFTSIIEDYNNDIYFGTSSNYIFKLKDNQLIPIKFDGSLNSNIFHKPSRLKFFKINKHIIVYQHYKWSILKNDALIPFFHEKDYGEIDTYNYQVIPNGKLFNKNTSGNYTFNNKSYFFKYIKEYDIQIIQSPREKGINIVFTKNNIKYKILGIDSNNKRLNNYKLINNELTLQHSHTSKRYITNATVNQNNATFFHNHEGIYKVNDGYFNFKKELDNAEKYGYKSSISSRSFIENTNGDLYLFTYQSILVKRKNTSEWLDLNNEIQLPISLIKDSSGMLLLNPNTLLVHGYNNMLLKINLKTKTTTTINTPIKSVYYAIKHDHNTLYLATEFGLFSYNISQNKTTLLYELNTTITYLKEHNNKLYIATARNGLYIKDYTTNKLTHYTKTTKSLKLVSNNLSTLFFDSEDFLWVGTKKGLQKIDFKSKKYTVFNFNNGLVNDNITSIQEDHYNLWISTFEGLIKLDKKTNYIKTFFKNDGLPDNEFNYWSSIKTKDSTIYFGGIKGIVSFKNNIDIKYQSAFNLFLTEYSYFDKNKKKNVTRRNLIDYTPQFTIPYEKNYLTLKFAINNVADVQKNFFQYKIDELHKNWVDLENYNTIQFAGLLPNKYTLKVRGFTAEGIETPTKTYTIKVNQVFYKSNLFILLNFLIVGVFLYLLSMYRNKQLRLQYKQNQTIQQLEAKAMRAQMNPHFIFNTLNSMQSVMILKGEREANKYFTSFSKLIRLTLDMNNTEMIPLKDEITYLESYLQLENLRLNNTLNYKINKDNSLNDTNNKIPCMMLQPIIENALIHGLTPKKTDLQLIINFQDDLENIRIEIIDNGIGREASGALQKKSNKNHKSWATHILNERITMSNEVSKQKISFKIYDLKDNQNNSLGTKVTLKIPKSLEPKQKISIKE